MKQKYYRVILRPHRLRRYPYSAKLITFIMYGRHYMGAAQCLMTWMGYGCTQYDVVSVEECKCPRSPRK